MEKIERYRQILLQVMARYTVKPSNGEIETELIVDHDKNHFEIMHVGWDGQRRVHGPVIHVDIRSDKIWIQHDGTNRPIAEALVDAGIPREDIVLAFHPAELRKYTEYAVG